MVKLALILLLSSLCILHTGLVYAEGEEGEQSKPKQPPKPRPDSAISVILQLPIVHKWQDWVASKHNDSQLEVWGESIKEVTGSKCWSVVVAEVDSSSTRIWKRFCVQKTGIDIWVEIPPADPTDDMQYLSYEKWLDKCEPTENSPGKC